MIDEHSIILIWVNECHVNGNCMGRATTFAVVISNREKIAIPIHTLFSKSYMEV